MEAREPCQGPVLGLAELQHDHVAAWSRDAAHFGEPARAVFHVADPEGDGHTVEARVGKGQGLGRGRFESDASREARALHLLAADGQHVGRRIDAHDLRFGQRLGDGDGQIAGARRDVEHARGAFECERRHGAPTPALIDAERDDAVQEVVAIGDGVEHLPASRAHSFGHALPQRSRPRPARASGGRACAPSLSAAEGSSWTSIISPVAPAASAARASGRIKSRRPAA